MLVVFTTTPDKTEAESLARRLVEERLAGCVQVLPQITSFYRWENQVKRGEECLLLIKTPAGGFAALEGFINANHSYSLPEIIAVEASNVSDAYLKWLEATTAN
jgi:periplasmic divalent cation tolerance protein